MADARSHKFDLILTKSLSRFARNTVVALSLVRELTALGITIDFEKESINTLDSKGEVLLTIMASLAQQESQSLSQNVKLSLQYRYQQGKVQSNHHRFLGYDKDEDGNLVLIPEEAENIRRVFREYLEGQSLYTIAKALEADGILTGAGKTKWYDTTIRKILQNEKYMGDALLQKTYTINFLTKRRIKNTGEMPQYYIEDHHEAIIPKHLFYAAQEEMLKRQNGRRTGNRKKRCYSSSNPFSNLIVCGNCGDIFRRVHWNNRGCKSIVWRCCSRLEATGHACHNRTVNETLLEQVVIDAINRVLCQKDDYDAIADEILRLRDQRRQAEVDSVIKDEQMKQIRDLQDFVKSQPATITEFDETLVSRLIEKITVFDEHFTVDFKSGITIDIEA